MMLRTRLILLFLSLFILIACTSTVTSVNHKTEVEEVISAKDLPLAVLMALPKKYGVKEFTYKRKLKEGVVSYEVNYEKGREKLSIAYDEHGKILEEEKKIKFSDLPHELRIKVDSILSAHYPGYRIKLVEEVYIHNETLLEVFFAHPKAKTGFVEAIFDYQTGILKEFVNMQMKSIRTLN